MTACIRCRRLDADAWLCSACQEAIVLHAANVALQAAGLHALAADPAACRACGQPTPREA